MTDLEADEYETKLANATSDSQRIEIILDRCTTNTGIRS